MQQYYLLFPVFQMILIFYSYWRLTERWKSYSSTEPSEFYIKSTRLGGIAFIVIGVVVSILPLILE